MTQKSFFLLYRSRWSHLITSLGSALFGFIYIAIWESVLVGKALPAGYQLEDFIQYIVIGQLVLQMAVFLTPDLDLEEKFQSGMIEMEMMRPTSFLGTQVCIELGKIAYRVLFRTFPVLIVFLLVLQLPKLPELLHFLLFVVSLTLAIWLAIQMCYTIGIVACWLEDVRWLYTLYISLLLFFGGQMIPIDIFPEWLQLIARSLPFACIINDPIQFFLGRFQGIELSFALFWGVFFTFCNMWLTRQARLRIAKGG